MKRLGIFGGVFDPVHLAHLIEAENAREHLKLDKVIFIPSGTPPIKNSDRLLDAEIRLHLVKLAIDGNPNFESSDIEVKNKTGKSYTVDTLLKLSENFKGENVKLYLIIGIDNFAQIRKWKEPEKIFTFSEVVVINRPGYDIREIKNEFSNRILFIPEPIIDISATDIRNRVKERRTIKYLVPEKIEKYILENKLYL